MERKFSAGSMGERIIWNADVILFFDSSISAENMLLLRRRSLERKRKKKKKQEAYNVNKWILQKYVKHGEYSARYNKIGKDIFPALGFIFFNYIHSRKHEFAQVSAVYLWEK